MAKTNTWKPAYYVLAVEACTTCEGTGIFSNTNPMNGSTRRTRCPDCGGAATRFQRQVPLLEAVDANIEAIRALIKKAPK